jgi:DNA-binding response OmpR family regulator
LFCTARGDMADKEKGFLTGADDYLLKPFDMRELALRAQALLRRPRERKDDSIRYHDFLIDPRKGIVKRNDKQFRLQPREMALFEFFARNRGLIFSSSALIDRVWSLETEATDISVRGCIARLRKKLEIQDGEPFIENLRGMGYRLPED